MKRIIALGFVLTIFLASFTGCSKEVKPNGETIYNHVSMVGDETNMFEVIGFADYVFVGVVESVNKRDIDDEFPNEYYSVAVAENLKGSLITDSNIEVIKRGGYSRKGTLILYASDNLVGAGLCEVGEKYIFIGFGQPDGSLLLEYLSGNVEYTDDLYYNYLAFIENQMDIERERFKSSYDLEYEK